LTSYGQFPTGWVARAGITADAVRQRVIDATAGVALPEAPLLEPPPLDLDPAEALGLAPNRSAMIPADGVPGVQEVSGCRLADNPSREAGPGSTSSTVTATRC